MLSARVRISSRVRYYILPFTMWATSVYRDDHHDLGSCVMGISDFASILRPRQGQLASAAETKSCPPPVNVPIDMRLVRVDSITLCLSSLAHFNRVPFSRDGSDHSVAAEVRHAHDCAMHTKGVVRQLTGVNCRNLTPASRNTCAVSRSML
jgi:hypothetical protein